MERALVSVTIFVTLFCAGVVLGELANRDVLFQGQDLRLYELYETTSWPFLEDCYNSHNAYRRLRDVPEIKLNRTVSIPSNQSESEYNVTGLAGRLCSTQSINLRMVRW